MAESADTPSSAAAGRDGARMRVPLTLVLVGGVTLLILVAVGGALTTTLLGATTNTFSLLANRATTTLDLLETRIGSQLDPVEIAGTQLGAMFADGRLDLDDKRVKALDTFGGVLRSVPEATGILFIRRDNTALRATLREGLLIEVPGSPRMLARQQTVLELGRQTRDASWGRPLWINAVSQAVHSWVVPVWRGDEFHGVVVVSVTLDKITAFLEAMQEKDGLNAFILYDRRYVLGHPHLKQSDFRTDGAVDSNPLPTIDDIDEPAFQLLENGEQAEHLLELAPRVSDARTGRDYFVLTREIARYGEAPWTIGLRFDNAEVTVELRRLFDTALIGLAILIAAALTGYIFARRLNTRIARLADAALALRGLEMSKVPMVPDSRLTELSNAARAFNAMIGALRVFETYVPKSLVLRLMHRPDSAAVSETRDLTILFTDIKGFSTLAEKMTAEQTASLLNGHFALLAGCVEAEGGTVDKYIGDGMMAFWGAPDPDEDHAARALRAAAAICRAVTQDNRARRARGEAPIRIRMGLHTGPAVVGNIGSPSRVNYTVVGDTVNTTARLESLPKELGLDGDCVVLLSAATRDAAGAELPDGVALTPVGAHTIRGRDGKIDAYLIEIK